MKIDSTHRRWGLAWLAILAAAVAMYLSHSRGGAGPPGGGSVPGLIFGCAGYAFMIYAALLGLRKKFPLLRAGRASTWMRGHLWLGGLSFPLLLLHSGFAANGALTYWLMVLLIAVIVTGVLGALVQHFLPTIMTKLVPLETIYEEIPKIREQLRAEADKLVSPVLGSAGSGVTAFVWGARPAKMESVAAIELAPDVWERFREVYSETIYPFLQDPDRVTNECSEKDRSAAFFAGLRIVCPGTVHQIIADLENICEEERQLKRQKVMYRWLHGWLLVHVPLSLALILLGGIHAVVALWY
jgi:hypothetical protein